ncbi:MAG TPA: hypothetical protein RMH99_02815 [Sandaracinaceae bacterium LLY-WYZ-13_1]|nr:hypothetical protein [Sandaracinaceae bacterium LLY-WYZ-13_1]
MATERWLTLPEREGIRTPELMMLIQNVGNDYARAWDGCEEPPFLVEMAAAAGLPVDVVLGAVAKCCADAWSHWSGGATDARPMQIVNSVSQWVRGDAGFEEIWSTWELAEQVRREVRDWHQQQQGAVLANAIVHAVESVHALVTTARNLAQPEAGHDQYDEARYRAKNAAAENKGLLHDAAAPVRLATTAGSWFHSHSEPNASAEDHEAYAKQIMGFVIRQALDAEDVVQGLRDRLR